MVVGLSKSLEWSLVSEDGSSEMVTDFERGLSAALAAVFDEEDVVFGAFLKRDS